MITLLMFTAYLCFVPAARELKKKILSVVIDDKLIITCNLSLIYSSLHNCCVEMWRSTFKTTFKLLQKWAKCRLIFILTQLHCFWYRRRRFDLRGVCKFTAQKATQNKRLKKDVFGLNYVIMDWCEYRLKNVEFTFAKLFLRCERVSVVRLPVQSPPHTQTADSVCVSCTMTECCCCYN